MSPATAPCVAPAEQVAGRNTYSSCLLRIPPSSRRSFHRRAAWQQSHCRQTRSAPDPPFAREPKRYASRMGSSCVVASAKKAAQLHHNSVSLVHSFSPDTMILVLDALAEQTPQACCRILAYYGSRFASSAEVLSRTCRSSSVKALALSLSISISPITSSPE